RHLPPPPVAISQIAGCGGPAHVRLLYPADGPHVPRSPNNGDGCPHRLPASLPGYRNVPRLGVPLPLGSAAALGPVRAVLPRGPSQAGRGFIRTGPRACGGGHAEVVPL